MKFTGLLLTASWFTWLSAAAVVACSSAGDATARAVEAGPALLEPDAGTGADGADATDAGLVTVQILAFNDFHGHLEPPGGTGGVVAVPISDPLVAALGADGGVRSDPDAGRAAVPAGGAAYLATHVKRLRSENPNTVVVSAGDMTGASPLLSALFRDEPAVLAMNAIGLDFNGVGNHEFDRGLDELLRLQKGGCSRGDCDAGTFPGAKFQYLAANVVNERTRSTVLPPYGFKTFGGVKVAFIGMTLEGTPEVTVEKAVAGLSFAGEVATVNALVPTLEKEGASAIVLLVHQGGFQAATGTYDTCESLTGDVVGIANGLDPRVSVVVSAHTHQPYNCTVGGKIVTSAASFGRVLTRVELTIDPVLRRVVQASAKNVVVTRDVTPDPEVSSLIASFQTRSAPLANRVVGHVTADLTASASAAASASCETPLGDVIADAQLWATSSPESGGAVVSFMNPQGIRSDLVYVASGAEGAGVVTYAEAFAVQPFGNNLVTITLTGAQIQTLLDQQFAGAIPRVLQVSSGLSYEYAFDGASKKWAVTPGSVSIDGVPLDLAKGYRVTVNAFLAGGGDGFTVLKQGTERRSGVVDLDALVEYLGVHDPIAPPPLDRIRGGACSR